MTQPSPSITTRGDIAVNVDYFRRHLRAVKRSPRTQKTYLEAVDLFAQFLHNQGMPTDVENITREHIESFITHVLDNWKATTAANRYGSIRQFFRCLDEADRLPNGNPMARMKPPHVPEVPPDVLRESELKTLLDSCKGKDFESRRDHALLRIFIDTGARLNEVAGLAVWRNEKERTEGDIDLDHNLLWVMGKGRRPRQLPIGNKTVKALDDYLYTRSRHPHGESQWLWLGAKGRLTDSGLRQVIRRRGRQEQGSRSSYTPTSCVTVPLTHG